jgi:23S rRNA pseudouridine2605 synthase
MQVALDEALAADRGGRLPDREQFGMRGRIPVTQRAVAGAHDHRTVAHDHATNRHLAGRRRGTGFLKGHIHERCHLRFIKTPMPGIKPPMKPSMTKPQSSYEGERIAKVMARAGLCSRRDAEGWIAAGRVAVNGNVIKSPALNIGPDDTVAVDGKPLPKAERTRLFLYHKPRGLVTTHADPEGRPTIFGKLPKNLPRLISVGRLDLSTEGLLLLTNDGGLARVLELPETGWLRRYRVRAHGSVSQPQLDALRKGVTVNGVHYGAIEATLDRSKGSNVWLTFAIREGKNREVRNVLEHLGLQVNRLIRVSFGPFQLGELPEGDVEEIRTRYLRDQLGERIASASGADFEGPIVQHRAVEEDEAAPIRKPVRDPDVRAQRASKDDRPRARHPEARSRLSGSPEIRSKGSKSGKPDSRGTAARPPQDEGNKKRDHRNEKRDAFQKKQDRFKHRAKSPRGGKRDRK